MTVVPRAALALTAVLTITTAAPACAQGATGATAFAVEAGGATAGSLASAALAYRLANARRGWCGVEDLACYIGRLAVMGAASIPGAAAGGYLAGRAAETQPSGLGSTLGAVAGVATGAASARAVEWMGFRSRRSQAAAYVIAQGLTTALGSRWLARR